MRRGGARCGDRNMTNPPSDLDPQGPAGQSDAPPDPASADRTGESARRWASLAAILALVVVVLAVLLVRVLTKEPDRPAPAQVTVPDLVGRSLDDARVIARAIGLDLAPTGRISDQPVSTIIDQDPRPGTTLDQGSTIGVTIAIAAELVVVPDLRGSPEANALRALADAGLVPGTRAEAPDSVVAAGSIVSQSPAAGTRIGRGAPVSYVVSGGAETPPTSTPTPEPTAPVATPSPPTGGGLVVGDYGCLTLRDATARIRGDGFALGRISHSIEGGPVDDTWIVDRQTPVPGGAYPRGAPIDLLLASPFNACQPA